MHVAANGADSTSVGTYDLVVLGGGPAGEKGAAQAAYFGKRVALIDPGAGGGVVTGTLPSKALRETALYLSGVRSRGLYGIDYSFDREISVEDLFFRQKAVERTHVALVEENLSQHRIEVFRGRGSLIDAQTVRVQRADGGTATLRGRFILVAVGSRPARPSSVPFDDERIFDTETILGLRRIPRSLVVVGAGVIGTEYATLFAALGSAVTLVDPNARLLPFIDGEIAAALAGEMGRAGVRICFGRQVREITAAAAGACVTLDDGERIEADAALYCIGRCGNTEGLGLEALGIALDGRGRIGVDEHYATAAPSVLAAGDVIGFPALASTSMEQARVAVCQAFGFAYKRQVSSLVPYGIYTIPELSMLGETEETLRARGTPYCVGRGHFRRNARGQIIGDTAGMIKLVFDPGTRRLLGVHIIGERASELVHVGQMVMQHGGAIDVFIDSVFNFPTLADAYKYAAYDGLQALEGRPAGATSR